MLKFLALLVLLAGAFGSGFHFGQRPVGTLQQTIRDLQHSLKDLSRNVLDTTLGIERDLRKRQGLVEAKGRIVQARADLLENNFGEAAKELAEAVDALEDAAKGTRQDSAVTAIKALAGKTREVWSEIARGKSVSPRKLNEIQKEVDRLLDK